MALTVTLTELRSAVRDRADVVGSQRVTDAKVDRAINSAIKRLHAKLVAVAEDDYTERAVLVTAEGLNFAFLPSDFLALRDVAWDPAGVITAGETRNVEGNPTEYFFGDDVSAFDTYVDTAATVSGGVSANSLIQLYTASGNVLRETLVAVRSEALDPSGTRIHLASPVTYSGGYQGDTDYLYVVTPAAATSASGADLEPVRRFQLQERARYQGGRGTWCRGAGIAYRLVGPSGNPKRIEFIPAPGSQRVVVVWYVPTPTLLSAATDTYDGQSGFEEWIVWDAAIQILIAEESDTSVAIRERDYVYEAQILPLVTARDQARVDRVVDMDGDVFYEEWGADD